MPSVINEHAQFLDELTAIPIVDGFVYIGIQNQDPTLLANQITIYADRALTIPIANPQRTGADGRTVNKIWVPGEYSIQVNDSNDVQKHQELDAGEEAVGAGDIVYTPLGGVATTLEEVASRGHSLFDFMTDAEKADITANTALLEVTVAIQTALNAAHTNGWGEIEAPPGTYLTSEIEWPGNNIILKGAGSGWGYDSSATPRTIFKAAAGTTNVFDLTQTGTAQDRNGNHLVDFMIDGDGIAVHGIEQAFGNTFTRLRITGCTTAGLHLANFTNSALVHQCSLYSNSGVGLKVSGSSTTLYTVTNSLINSNTVGGILLESGFGATLRNCVVESNTGYGIRLDKVSAHTGSMGTNAFTKCWFEDNAATGGSFVVEIDAFDNNANFSPLRTSFEKCRFSIITGRKFLSADRCKWLTFDECNFGWTLPIASGQIVTTSQSQHISITRHSTLSGQSGFGPKGLLQTDLEAMVTNGGVGCYHSDSTLQTSIGSVDITGATQAAPVVITATAHGFLQGEEVLIVDGGGMTELDGNTYRVGIVAANTMELSNLDGTDLDGTGFTAYSTGGTLKRPTDIDFAATWSNFGTPYGDARVWFDEDGYVNLSGHIATSGSINTLGFTLKVGYRPSHELNFVVESNGAFGQVTVEVDGDVIVKLGSTTRTSLDGIRYLPAQK